MSSTKKQVEGLPEPMALTPAQLAETAAATAGGLSLASLSIIRAGGYPPVILSASMGSVATLAF